MPRSNTFAAAAADLRKLKLGNSPEVRHAVSDALVPLRDQVKANVHSVSGRTVQATMIVEGHGSDRFAVSYVKVDQAVAAVFWRARRFFYPRAVEAGHGGKHAAAAHPFFREAVESTRSAVAGRLRGNLQELISNRVERL